MPIDPSIAANSGYRPPTPIDFGQIAQQREAVRNAMLQGQLRANQIQDYNRYEQEITAEGFDPNDPATQNRLAQLANGRDFLTSLGSTQTYNNNRASGARERTRYTQEQISRHIPGDVEPTHMQQAQEQILSIPDVDAALVNDYFDRLRNEPDPMRRLQLMHQLANADPQVRAAIGASLPIPSQINQGDHIVIWDSNPQSLGYGHQIGTYPVRMAPGTAANLAQTQSRDEFNQGAGTPPGLQRRPPPARQPAPAARPSANPPGTVSSLPPRFRLRPRS